MQNKQKKGDLVGNWCDAGKLKSRHNLCLFQKTKQNTKLLDYWAFWSNLNKSVVFVCCSVTFFHVFLEPLLKNKQRVCHKMSIARSFWGVSKRHTLDPAEKWTVTHKFHPSSRSIFSRLTHQPTFHVVKTWINQKQWKPV